MLVIINKIIWIIAATLWTIGFIRNFFRKESCQPDQFYQGLNSRFIAIIDNFKKNSRLLISLFIIFIIANCIFYFWLSFSFQAKYIGDQFSFEQLTNIALILIGIAAIFQTIDNLARGHFIPAFLRWLTIVVCLIGYFIYSFGIVRRLP